MACVFLALALLGLFGSGANVNFDTDRTGEMPPDWTAIHTHHGPPGEWVVRPDPTAPSRHNVLSQVSRSGERYEFHLAVFDKLACRNGDLTAKIRIRSGPGSETAGLVWRFQDPENYYLLHLSAREKNVALFRIQNGKAQEIPVVGPQPGAAAVSHDVRPGVWYLARVVFRGSRFRVMLGNRLLFEATDSGIQTAGKTGVWTKGSTMASFDDFGLDKKN